jgi:hypothetical protein
MGPEVGGTRVTVLGYNLNQGVVYVDGRPVAIQPCSPPRPLGTTALARRTVAGHLCFVTPPHAAVTIRSPNGKVSNGATFRYQAGRGQPRAGRARPRPRPPAPGPPGG